MTPKEVEDVVGRWVLIKRGLYWRPDAQGYTGIKSEAGRYSDAYAARYTVHDDDATTKMLWEEAPELSPGCSDEVARRHLSSLLRTQAERIEELEALRDRLILEAQCHSSEARTANSTICEIYQVLSGGKGEPGNWNGAEPARQYVSTAQATLERYKEVGRQLGCPRPCNHRPDEFTVGECIDAGECGCVAHVFAASSVLEGKE